MQRWRFWPFRGDDESTCREVREHASDLIAPQEDDSKPLVDRLQQHLAWCAPCSAFVRTLQATVDMVRTMPRQSAPDRLKEQLRRLAEEGKEPP